VTAAKEKLEQHGFTHENPNKAKMDTKYRECVKAKLALGLT